MVLGDPATCRIVTYVHKYYFSHHLAILVLVQLYRMAGNFRGIQFSRKAHLQRFRDLIFADGHSRVAPPLTARAPQLRNRPKKNSKRSIDLILILSRAGDREMARE